jgi:hypothetical protein
MAHGIEHFPDTVYPSEIKDECPEALEAIDALIFRMQTGGPSPEGYDVKTLGRQLGGLWQISLKIVETKRQVRVLYAPYGQTIALFRIHKKGSRQEQQRAYELAMKRKAQYEAKRKMMQRNQHGKHRTN